MLISHADLSAGKGKGKRFNKADFKVELSGDQEVPPVVNGTYGEGKFIVNADWTVDFELELEDAENALGAAGAHIHCAPAGANGPVVVFLAGMSPPGFDGHLEKKGTLSDASIVNPACGSPAVVSGFADRPPACATQRRRPPQGPKSGLTGMF